MDLCNSHIKKYFLFLLLTSGLYLHATGFSVYLALPSSEHNTIETLQTSVQPTVTAVSIFHSPSWSATAYALPADAGKNRLLQWEDVSSELSILVHEGWHIQILPAAIDLNAARSEIASPAI